MKKFLLIDGSCMLTTAYYACIPPEMAHAKDIANQERYYSRLLKTSDGKYTNALYATVNMFLNVVSHVRPDYLAIAFDEGRDTFRRKRYEFYKANRTERPLPLADQFMYVQDIFKKMGFAVFSDGNYEADDLIASVIQKCWSPETDFYIYSKDHDFMQLVDHNVFLLRPMHATSYEKLMALRPNNGFGLYRTYLYDRNSVKLDTGVLPSEIIDLLSILGDSGDNIPGCKRVKKQAVGLINYYYTVERLYEAIDYAEGSKNGKKNLVDFWKSHGVCDTSPLNQLIKYKSDVFASKWLLTMRKNALFGKYKLDDFVFELTENAFRQALDAYGITGLVMPEGM